MLANEINNIAFSYIHQLYSAKQDFHHKQSQLINEVSAYKKTRYNIIQLAMNQILKSNPELKDGFLLVSLIDSQNISGNWIANYWGAHKASELLDYMQYYGLIELNPGKANTFSMHRSVQAIIRKYMFDFFPPKELHNHLEKISDFVYICANQAIESDECILDKIFLNLLSSERQLQCLKGNKEYILKIASFFHFLLVINLSEIYENKYV